ncbi:MAG: flagellar hook-associated protein FlgL [Proteobacteria bacterium]|nr:flagellar hook-associated protein FlgL [Pseudomonadota bacterium]
MRVSDSVINRLVEQRLSRSRERTAEAFERVSTGLRVNQPSDDPLASALGRRTTREASRAKLLSRSVTTGLSRLQVADSALNEASGILARARELAVMGATETANADNRAMIAREVATLRDALISLGNTKSSSGYVFAGYNDDAPPFDAAGTYSGDGNVRELEVSTGLRIAEGVSGARVFGIGSGTDIMQVMQDLRAALEGDDVGGVQATLDRLEAGHDQVQQARGELGNSVNLFEGARAALERVHDRSVAERAELTEADVMQAFSQLAKAEQALQVAVAVASRLPLPGLVGGD